MPAKEKPSFESYVESERKRYTKLSNKIFENAKLSGKETKDLQKRLYKMINYVIDRHDWYSDQRNLFMQIGIGLLAASSTVAVVFAQFAKSFNSITLFITWAAILSIFSTGMVLLYLFNRGVERNHPYRKIVEIKSWYFKYNFPSGLKDYLSSNKCFAKNQIKEIVNGKIDFLEKWLKLAKTPNGLIKEDLEQVFILQILLRYRSQQLKTMSRSLFIGLILAFCLFILSIISYPLLPNG